MTNAKAFRIAAALYVAHNRPPPDFLKDDVEAIKTHVRNWTEEGPWLWPFVVRDICAQMPKRDKGEPRLDHGRFFDIQEPYEQTRFAVHRELMLQFKLREWAEAKERAFGKPTVEIGVPDYQEVMREKELWKYRHADNGSAPK